LNPLTNGGHARIPQIAKISVADVLEAMHECGFLHEWRCKMDCTMRVRLGYLLGLPVFFGANLKSVALGAAIGIFGCGWRAYAAGYLKKAGSPDTTGPYAYTRNPSLCWAARF